MTAGTKRWRRPPLEKQQMSQHLGNTLKTRDNEIQFEYLFMWGFLHLKAPDQLGRLRTKPNVANLFLFGVRIEKKTNDGDIYWWNSFLFFFLQHFSGMKIFLIATKCVIQNISGVRMAVSNIPFVSKRRLVYYFISRTTAQTTMTRADY